MSKFRVLVIFLVFALGLFYTGGTALAAEEAQVGPGWTPQFGWNQVGQPNDSDKFEPYTGLNTQACNVIVVTTGDAEWTDSVGKKFSFPGKGKGESRGSILLMVGPVNLDGVTVAPTFKKKYSWVGVYPLLDCKLTGYTASRLVNQHVASMRDPKNSNDSPGKGLSGEIDVAFINGETARIMSTYTVYADQWAPE